MFPSFLRRTVVELQRRHQPQLGGRLERRERDRFRLVINHPHKLRPRLAREQPSPQNDEEDRTEGHDHMGEADQDTLVPYKHRRLKAEDSDEQTLHATLEEDRDVELASGVGARRGLGGGERRLVWGAGGREGQ